MRRTLTTPGWLDIQVNGYAGTDFNSGRALPADFERARVAQRTLGVTRFLPTVITGTPAGMGECIRRIVEARASSAELAAAMPLIHLEGPFISPEDGARGAHPLECVRPPDLALFEDLQAQAQGLVRLLTLAPEHEGSLDFIARVTAAGTRVAIGHSLASSERIREAVDAGATLSTHLGNGLPNNLRRHPNPLFDQLAEPRLSASAIFDGHHLPDSVMRVIHRMKAPGHLILTSDAVALAGMPAGVYEGQVGGKVELHSSGRLTMYGSDYLAGSASSLLDGINNAIRVSGLDVTEVVRYVTDVPATLLGLPPSDARVELAAAGGAFKVTGVTGRA